MHYLSEILVSQITGLTLFSYAVALIFCGLEHRFPSAVYPDGLQTSTSRWHRWRKNLGCYLVLVACIPLVDAVPVLFFSHLLSFQTVSWASNPLYMLLGIVMLDFSVYWSHRLSHTVPWLWAYHRVHHMDEFLDVTSAFRFHLFEVIQTIVARTFVVYLMGLNSQTVLIYLYLNAVVLTYQHTNVRTPPVLEKVIGKVFVTPAIHWIHHHESLPETNTNYCIIFSCWDRIFATRSDTARTPHTPIGLDSIDDQSIWRLQLFPAIRSRKRA